MFDQTSEIPSIPSETLRAARAVFNRKNFYILVGEQLDFLLMDVHQESLSETVKTSRAGGAILSLTTFFQFVEGLTDLQAMDAVRTRIDWKYALHLPVHTLTFHQSALCGFRQSVIKNPAAQCEFQKLVDRLITLEPPYNHVIENIEILALLSSICSTNIMNWALEGMNAALGVLAGRFPDWLVKNAQPHWYWRFNHVSPFAGPVSSRRQYDFSIEKLGADIRHLLEEVEHSHLSEIKELEEIKTLQHIWERYFDKEQAVGYPKSGNQIRINCDSCGYGAG